MLNAKARAAIALAEAVDALVEEDIPEALSSVVKAWRNTEGEPDEEREHLPSRRIHDNQKIVLGGHTMYIGVGEYEDGRMAELFVDVNREGAPLRAIFDQFAVAISLGLQYGVPLQEFIDAFVWTSFEPAGPVIGHARIQSATSLIDVIFKHLAIEYGCKIPKAPAKLNS